MENETLFKEEEEPPGPLTGLVNVKNNVSDFLLFNTKMFLFTRLKKSQIEFYFLLKIPLDPVFSETRNYPEITRMEWFDWHWQFRNAIRDVEHLISNT